MIGKILNGRYEIIDKIGEGGMAYVYRARCHLLNRDVAVKILKKEFSNDEETVEKFKGEAAAAAGLCGNNIVNIYDVGSEDDTDYIVMELVEGDTLKELIKEKGVLAESEAVGIAIQISKALQSAHGRRVIHRDIKPHNIIVGKNGSIKVADFGIAKAVDQSTITHTAKVMGTAHYFSPEQAKGGYVDFRSDIYSLGVVMYEMITGKVPHDSDSIVSVAIKHIQEEVIQPKELNNQISRGFNDIILKCLEKDPVNRYQKVQELLEDLSRVRDNKKVVINKKKEDMQQTKVMNAADVQREIEKTKQKRAEKNRKKDRKKYVIVAVFLVAVLGISAGVTMVVTNANKNKTDQEKVVDNKKIVPFIIGEKVEDIEDTIRDNDLSYSIEREAKSDYPEGTIIECKPVGGTKVESGTVLSLVVSRGPEGIKVSDYREMDINTVKGLLQSQGLKVGNIREEFSIIKAGKIISQSPKYGTEVDKNSEISFVISKGPEIALVKVPNLVDKTLSEAEEEIKKANLVMGNKTVVETSNANQKDLVFSQSISKGTEVKENSVIDISYYKYVEDDNGKTVMPKFIGKLGIDAEMKADAAGIECILEGDEFEKVYYQSIEPGEKIDPGELVILKTKKEEE